jgi:hypothetical protein
MTITYTYQHFPFNERPSKIYPNWDFWLENKPSGNPEAIPKTDGKKI